MKWALLVFFGDNTFPISQKYSLNELAIDLLSLTFLSIMILSIFFRSFCLLAFNMCQNASHNIFKEPCTFPISSQKIDTPPFYILNCFQYPSVGFSNYIHFLRWDVLYTLDKVYVFCYSCSWFHWWSIVYHCVS